MKAGSATNRQAAARQATKQSLVTTQANDHKITYSDMAGNKVDLSISAIKQYICPSSNISDSEAYMFLTLCQFNGLNPFLRDAYCIKYGTDPAAMIVSKSALMKRAQKNPKYKGIQSGVIVLSMDGKITERSGQFYLTSEELVGAWAKVFVDGFIEPVYISVNLREYIKTKDGKPTGKWRDAPATMIVKVAEAHALREAFPADLGGLYNAEEMGYEEVEATAAPITPTDVQDVAYTDMETGEVFEPDEAADGFFDQEE